MRTIIRHAVAISLLLSGVTVAARAQEVVHALTGVVTAVDPAGKTLTVATDDGSEGRFTTAMQPGVKLDFAPSMKAATVPAASLTATKTRVLVYYIGDNSVRTAVAVEDLGSGPFVKTTGTIVKMDRHTHELIVKDARGAEQSFKIDAKTVAEGAEGVEEGIKFDAHKGDQVRVTATTADGTQKALFIRST
jgi:hypothetical protein